MSYADIAAKNRLPESQQPHPDQSLLEGSHNDQDSSQSTASDEKIHVVTREEFQEEQQALECPPAAPAPRLLSEEDAPAKLEATRQAEEDAKKAEAETQRQVESAKKAANETKEQAKETKEEVKEEASKAYAKGEKKLEQGKEEAKKEYNEASAKGKKEYNELSEKAKKEYDEMSEKAKRAYDKLSAEAKQDWQKLSAESKKKWQEAKNSDAGQELQKPEVWGSLLGLANLAVVGTTIYFAYTNRNKPRWDKRAVSATVIGLAAWFGVQGYLLPQSEAVRQRRH